MKIDEGMVMRMRCGCPRCEAEGLESYMIHAERDNCCVCPECLYRCYACQGDGQALSREQIMRLKDEDAFSQSFFLAEHAARDAAELLNEGDPAGAGAPGEARRPV
ncbi:MAG: hypothetical protein IKQ41_00760 [Clostridia bacterium]|nr:hypothetical protein [Clostridia bacterium]